MIALHPPRLDAGTATAALAAELALLRELHMLLNEEERVLAPRSPGVAGSPSDALPAAVSQALAELATRRANLATRLQAASRARSELLSRVDGSPTAATNARSTGQALQRPNEPTASRMWRSVRSAYAHVARRQQLHAHLIQSHTLYLQSRWNGLMQSAGTARGYNRSGGAAPGHQTGRLLVSA